jgi:gas vesicle protein
MQKEEKLMTTNGKSKFSFLLIGLGLGAIGGLMAALLARKESRHLLRERSRETLDYLNQQGKKVRETTEGIVEKGKELMSHRCCSVDATTETQEQAYKEERREDGGG